MTTCFPYCFFFNLTAIHAKLFIDGLDVNVITSKTVHSTLTTVLGDNDCRFDVKVTSKPSIYTLKIIPKMVNDDLRKLIIKLKYQYYA